MKMRNIVVLIALTLTCASANAQQSFRDFKGTTVTDRLGHARDSVRNREFYNQYVEAYRKADWKACYRPWRELLDRAPFSTYNITFHAASVNLLLKNLIINETDSIERYLYFKDAMEVLDFALANYKSLNTFTDQTHQLYTPGILKCRKAYYYRELGKEIPQRGYKKEVAYKLYVDAFEALRDEKAGEGEEIEAFYLEEYFKSCLDLFETDKEKYYEQFLTDYTTCLEACDNMMAKYADIDEEKWQNYARARNNIQAYFYQNGAGESTAITNYYATRVEENKKNVTYLNNAVHLMFENGCIGTEVFYQTCENAYMLKPNYETCIGMGLSCMDIEYQGGFLPPTARDEAKQYFDEARGLAKTANEHYLAAKFTADAMAKTPKPVKDPNETATAYNDRYRSWQSIMKGSTIYYNEALQFAQEAKIPGQTLADVYYNMCNCYRQADDMDNALTALQQTKICYSEFSPEKYESMNNAIQSGKDRIARVEAANQAKLKNEAARAAWEKQNAERLRKQREEEAFWGKKK